MTREEAQLELSNYPTYLNGDDHLKEIMIGIFMIGYHTGRTDGIEEGAAIWRPAELNYKDVKTSGHEERRQPQAQHIQPPEG